MDFIVPSRVVRTGAIFADQFFIKVAFTTSGKEEVVARAPWKLIMSPTAICAIPLVPPDFRINFAEAAFTCQFMFTAPHEVAALMVFPLTEVTFAPRTTTLP